jgi:bifunctional DNase/RNase
MSKFSEMEVVGVRVEMPSNQPILLLKEKDGVRYLPIWVGAVEATAIAYAQQEVESVRPLTHELLATVIDTLNGDLISVHLTQMVDGIFYSQLNFSTSGGEAVVSARPSDSIALALRTGAPIFAVEELLEEAAIEIPDKEEDEVERFREFLDHINPEDFLT